MRVFAVSDLHVDYDANAVWVRNLSTYDYRNDLLILAGDVTDHPQLLERTLIQLAGRFRNVVYVPGNHELWIARDRTCRTSLDKLARVITIAAQSGVSMEPLRLPGMTVVPLLGWYDYSFGEPSACLRESWADYYACGWPDGYRIQEVAAHLESRNSFRPEIGERVITCSHFLPRTDVMPPAVVEYNRALLPVLGSRNLDAKLREIGSTLHVYGHSHFNRRIVLDGVEYINNALGYPSETRFAARKLLCICPQ